MPIISTTFILFSVSVPVLSEQITLLLPNVSTAGSFLIIAFLFAIFVTAMERIIVTIAGKPSGIAATAKPTDVINISTTDIFFITPITKIKAQITTQAIPSTLPTSLNFFWIGVCGASFVIIILAIFPTSVFIPILVTIPSACPFTTAVPAKTIFFMSPRGTFWLLNNAFSSFSTASVSPVRLDSSTFKLYVFINLISAGT